MTAPNGGIILANKMEIRYAQFENEWFAGYHFDAKDTYTSSPIAATHDPYPTADAAILSQWPLLAGVATSFATGHKDQDRILAYLEILGTRLQAITPCTPVSGTDPTGNAFIADLSEDEDEDPVTPQNPDAPADPGALERLKNAPPTHRDGSGAGSGPGGGFAAPDKRLKNIEDMLDELDKDQCSADRWDTMELVLDYLSGSHTIATLKNHLKPA